MHEIIAKSVLSGKNNMNIYRGCTHGCIYCDSRSECYGMTFDFEDIKVKTNAVNLLEKQLSKRLNRCVVTTGAMTDPYIPLERQLCNMRECLEVIERRGFGISILTKSDLVLRDIDVLQRINKKSKAVVQMTLTTHDETLCSKIEPNVASTRRRFEVLCEMNKEGMPTVVWMTPILPFLNDTEENIMGILEYCKEAKVKGLLTFGIGMTLRYGNREYYYKKLDELFPGLKQQYMRSFGCVYGIKSPNSDKLNKIITKFCKQNGILYRTKDVFRYILSFQERIDQVSMW